MCKWLSIIFLIYTPVSRKEGWLTLGLQPPPTCIEFLKKSGDVFIISLNYVLFEGVFGVEVRALSVPPAAEALKGVRTDKIVYAVCVERT